MAKPGDHELQTIRIPWMGNPTNRDTVTSKDQRYLNVYFDILKSAEGAKSYYLCKRPGYATLNRPPAGNAAARGIYSWNGKLYSVFANKIYSGTTDLGVTLTTSTGQCFFAEAHPAAVTQQLCINDGIKLYAISTTDVVTTISTIPTPNVRSLITFDRYWFTLQTNTALSQSNLDDSATWDGAKIIYSNMFNGSGVAIGHQNNLVYVFGNDFIQAFYDAANNSGSVLANVEQASQQIGCASTDSLFHDENIMMWVSNSKSGGYTVQKLEGSTGLEEISTPGINRILRQEGTSISSCLGRFMRIGGHSFYLLTLMGQARTLVYDLEAQLWLEWTDTAGTASFPLINFTQHLNTLVGQHATNGTIYTLSENTYQDDSVNFPVFGRFKRLDLDDNRRKFCKSAELVGDIQSSTTNVSLQYSDNDYVTLSTARTLDMAQSCPRTGSPLGNFKRRSWQISYTGANPLRMESLELVIKFATY